MPVVDVAIVGAGMAGLSAATAIRDAGGDVVVLEARARIGGRVHTLHDARTPVPVELGAELVHEGADAVHELVRQAHGTLDELQGSRWAVRDGATIECPDYDGVVERGLSAAFRARGDDISIEEALRRGRMTPWTRDITRAFVEGFHAGAATQVSMRALAKGGAEGPGKALRARSGYAKIVDMLGARIDPVLRMSTEVTRIAWREGRVELTTRGPTGAIGRVRARSAIVTVPLGVLAAGGISFEPALPSHARAWNDLDMGQVTKLTLRFREPFWRKGRFDRAAMFFDPGGAFPTFWTSRPFDAPVVVAWAGGPAASTVLTLGEQGAVTCALDRFAAILGIPRKKVHEQIETWFFHDWSNDAFARGAYSFARVGGATAYTRAAKSVASTLFFAGEHTIAPPDCGTVHGALESGRRAAKQVLRAIS